MTDKIKPLQQASEAQPEPADFDTWLKEQFEYKNWYYREGGSGGMAVPFARKAWNAGFAKCEDSQAGQCWKCGDADPDFQGKCEALAASQPAEPIGVVATNPILNTIGSAYVVRVLVGMPDAVRVGDKLYTAPPPAQQPLTKAQIKALIVATPEPDDSDVGKWVLSLIRAVEKAHKIGSRP